MLFGHEARLTMKSPRNLLWLAVALVTLAPAVGAQELPSEAQCRDALQRAATDARMVALEGILGGCGRAGTSVIASVIRSSAQEGDDMHFSDLRDVTPRSGIILDAAIGLASNAAASTTARIGGLRLMARQLFGRGGDITTNKGPQGLVREDAFCSAGVVAGDGDTTAVSDDPLPSDYRRQVMRVSEEVAHDRAAASSVRRVALCLRRSFPVPLPLEPLQTSTIAIANICDRQFRITNRGLRPVILAFEVVGRPGRTKIVAPVGHSDIAAEHPGLVQLYYDNRPLAAARSSDRRCATTPGRTRH